MVWDFLGVSQSRSKRPNYKYDLVQKQEKIKTKETPKKSHTIKHIQENLYEIILDPETPHPKTIYIKTPLNKFDKPKTRILKILWQHGLISQELVIHFYKKWRDENISILMEFTHTNGRIDKHETPVKRRGNERYHKYTWSRLQNNIMSFNGYEGISESTKIKERK